VLVAVCVGVDRSVAVSFTVNDLALVKVCVTEVPVPDDPSPKFQVTEYGEVPPLVVVVNVTGVFTTGLAGRNVKLVESGGGAETVIVWEPAAFWEGEEESVAVSVAVND